MRKAIKAGSPPPNPLPLSAALLPEHLRMVRFVAGRIYKNLPSSVEFDDLFSAGLVGLTEASAKFDPSKNVRFGSYAAFRVRGAILDSLRILDWAPRELRRKGRAVQVAIQELVSKLKREPLEDEVAAQLKTSLHAYQKLLRDLHGLEIGSLYRKRDDGSEGEEAVVVASRAEDDPLSVFLRRESAKRVAQAIEGLSERERLVATLYYYEEMTRKEIGLALGVDGNKVSQIRVSAMNHLRAALAVPPNLRSENLSRTASNGAGISVRTLPAKRAA